MIMGWIWIALAGVSLICALVQGSADTLGGAVLKGAQEGVALGISMAGSLCLWSGVGALMARCGMTQALARLLRPVLYRLFPSSRGDPLLAGDLSANLCANFLGLGNAATPMGIRAACRIQKRGSPTDELCRLIVLNTASIQLIPANVAAIRAGLGSHAPFDILGAVWITSGCSAALGLTAAWLLGKVWPE